MKPNILFLLVDQWPADCFGYKDADIVTPNIDRLAKEGTVFNKAFTSCPLCSPARGALFTSKWHSQSGMIDNLNVGYSTQMPLDMKQRTWLDAAVSQGYQVGYYGKWHLGANGPIDRGVQSHPGSIEASHTGISDGSNNYSYKSCADSYMAEGAAMLHGGIAPFYGKKDEAIASTEPFIIAGQGVDFIKSYEATEQKAPFLLTISINDPHFPHYLPEVFTKGFEDLHAPLPPNLENDFSDKPWFHNVPWWPSMDTGNLSKEDWQSIVNYAYMHRMMVDRALGQVIDQLESSGLLDSTMIIFTSDHGDMCGAHNRFDKGPYFYEEVWRIPLIIKAPYTTTQEQDALVSILDIGQTVFDLVGEGKDDRWGNSLVDLLEAESHTKPSNYVYGMYDLYNGMSFRIRAIRSQHYKYVFNPQSVDEFYDLRNDPHEMTNLTDWVEVKEEKKLLREDLFRWMNVIEDPLLNELEDLPKAGLILSTGKDGP